MLTRETAKILTEKAAHYPILAITGPRQAGKSTLAKMVFPKKPYCNLEALDQREFAKQDPRRFLSQFPEGAILDEIQHCPELFSYLQALVDEHERMGLFILTGSQQFDLHANITQSLAGRVGIIQLLPFSYSELECGFDHSINLEQLMFQGAYPPIYHRHIPAQTWQADYIMTYLQRDVRQLINVRDLHSFQRFLKMCAARVGQLLNLSTLANDCGITHNTAKAWISVLEASYIVFQLQPHYQNFNKRLTKTPKLYFYDTGIVCSLLGLQDASALLTHPIRGPLFENWVISELVKHYFNQGRPAPLYFWRDSQGHEIDVLIDQGGTLYPIEIKSGQTIVSDFFNGLQYWKNLSGQKNQHAYLIYAGDQNQQRTQAHIVSWQNLKDLNLVNCQLN